MSDNKNKETFHQAIERLINEPEEQWIKDLKEQIYYNPKLKLIKNEKTTE